MSFLRKVRRLPRPDLCTVLIGLSLGFMLTTWLRVPLDGQRATLVDKRCNDAAAGRGAAPDRPAAAAAAPSTPSKNLIHIGVMTAQKYLTTRGVAVNRTWARTIPGKVSFYTSANTVADPELGLPIVRLPGVDDSYPPQKKSFLLLKHMHDNFIDRYEWFMRADDDIYVRGDRLEPFLRSVNSSRRLYIGQAGLGKQEEMNLLNLDAGDNFCMGGTGMIFSRETLRKLIPHISYCLKNLWSFHEDVEVGRCIKKFAEVDCTWAYEMQVLFYNNYSKSDTAFTGSLDTSDVHKAITLHPIKRTPYMYRLHNHLQSTKILELQMKTMHLYRSILETRQLLNEDEDRADGRGPQQQQQQRQQQPPLLPQLSSLGLQPGLMKYAPDGHEDLIAWDFFGKSWYSVDADAPVRRISNPQTEGLNLIAREVMTLINGNSVKVGRTIDFKEILYGYARVVPPYGVDYVLDLLLMYHKHSKSKRIPVRRHAYLQQSFGRLEMRFESDDAPAGRADSKSEDTSGMEKLRNGISEKLFGSQQQGRKGSARDPHREYGRLGETIHFVLPLAGRLQIFRRFLENLERVCFVPRESIKLVVVLFRSAEEDDPSEEIEQLVGRYSGKYPETELTVVHAEGAFSRGRALALGASKLPPDALMFFVDVDMHLKPGFLTRCRLNTRRGRQVYYPAVFGQYNLDVTYGPDSAAKPESKLSISKENGFFRHYGFGLVCLYNQDLAAVGGLDSTIVGWGMEDVDLYQKFAASNVTILRAADPGLIHLYHPMVCDSKLDFKQYKMCMGSKLSQYGSSRNLARILDRGKVGAAEEDKGR